MNRRNLFALAPAAFVAMASPAAATGADDALAYAISESREISLTVARLNNLPGVNEAEWEAWEARDTAFLTWAERLPLTPDFAKAKAIAFRTIYDRGGGLDEFLMEKATTDQRLALQIVKCLLGAV